MKFDINGYDTQKQIQAFVNGELTGEELSAFEKELQSNKALQEEVEFSQGLAFTLHNSAAMDVNSMINDIKSEVSIEPDFDLPEGFEEPEAETGLDQGSKIKLLIGIAAAIGAMAIMIWLIQLSPATTTHTKIADRYLEPFENVIVTNPANNDQLSPAMTAYDEARYGEAAQQLEAYTQKRSDNSSAKLYLGISHILNNEPTKAISPLLEIAQSKEVYASTGKWYLALAYLKTNDEAAAKPLLRELSKDKFFIYNEKANEILQKLEPLN